MSTAPMKGRLRPPASRRRVAALPALALLLALCFLGGCSRLLSIVDPSAF